MEIKLAGRGSLLSELYLWTLNFQFDQQLREISDSSWLVANFGLIGPTSRSDLRGVEPLYLDVGFASNGAVSPGARSIKLARANRTPSWPAR